MNKTFHNYCVTLLNAGFTLVGYNNNSSYVYAHIVSPNNRIGYIQECWYNKDAIDMSVSCKPSKETGSGCQLHEEVVNPTVELAAEVCNTPYGTPYSGIDEYIAYHKKFEVVSGVTQVIHDEKELAIIEDAQNTK